MKPLRWLAAGLLWILTGVVSLLGVLLSLTVVLLPLGIPLLMLARRLGALAAALVIPRAVRHPVDEASAKASDTASSAGKGARRLFGGGREAAEAAPDRARKLGKKAKKRLTRRRGLTRFTPWG